MLAAAIAICLASCEKERHHRTGASTSGSGFDYGTATGKHLVQETAVNTNGDRVEVLGELRESPRSLNIEKLHVLETVDEYEKVSKRTTLKPDCFLTNSGRMEPSRTGIFPSL